MNIFNAHYVPDTSPSLPERSFVHFHSFSLSQFLSCFFCSVLLSSFSSSFPYSLQTVPLYQICMFLNTDIKNISIYKPSHQIHEESIFFSPDMKLNLRFCNHISALKNSFFYSSNSKTSVYSFLRSSPTTSMTDPISSSLLL